jgi:anti-sigma factor RsiW
MSCNELEALWIPCLDGKLPPRQRALVEAHVSDCAECAVRLRELEAVSQALAQWEAPAPSPWFDARLRQRIAADTAARGWWQWVTAYSPAFPVSVAVLLFLAALLIWTGGGQQALPPAQVVTVERADDVVHVVEELDLLSDFEPLSEMKGHPHQEETGRQ